MTRLEQIGAAADLKAAGLNMATAGLLGVLAGPAGLPRWASLGFAVAGVVAFGIGRRWE